MVANDIPSTRDLVERARSGDREAFDSIIARYRPRLESLIHLRLGAKLRARVEVDDVFQEGCLKAYRSLGSFQWRNEGSFLSWLGEIVENVIRSIARQRLPMPFGPSPNGDPEKDADAIAAPNSLSPIRALQREERFKRLEDALNRLSPEHREVIILARIQGLPMKEIAERMDRSEDAASMLLLRALRKLGGYFGRTESFGLPERSLDPRPSSGDSGAEGTGPVDG